MSHACPFCRDFSSTAGGANIIIGEGDDLVVVSDFAPIVDGHILICPREHYTSFANCPPALTQKALALARHILKSRLQRGHVSVIAEHGTGQAGGPSTACCDHAHLHILSLRNDQDMGKLLELYTARAGPAIILDNSSSMSKFDGSSYNIIGGSSENIYLWENVSSFFPQFFRNSVCKIFDYPSDDPRLFWQTSVDKRTAISGGINAISDLPSSYRRNIIGWKTVNKLVRDYIPDKIAVSGDLPVVRHLSGDELFSEVAAKVGEELSEFLSAPSLDEAADVFEALNLLFSIHGYDWDDVKKNAVTKANTAGGFEQRRLLEYIIFSK